MEIFGDNIENIDVALKHYLIPRRGGVYIHLLFLHLKKDTFVSMESGVMFVDIRKWFVPKLLFAFALQEEEWR